MGSSTRQRQECPWHRWERGTYFNLWNSSKASLYTWRDKKEKLEFSHPELATHRGLLKLTTWGQCKRSRQNSSGFEWGCARAVPLQLDGLNKRSKHFLGKKHEIVDFRSSQFSEKTSTLQTEGERFALPKMKWEKRSVSKKAWLSIKHPEHQKSFSLIKSSRTSQPPSQTVLWSCPSVCGKGHEELLGSQCGPVLAWSETSTLCRRRKIRQGDKEMRATEL